MDGQRFDDLTRKMATGTSRRHALRLLGGGLVGAVLAAVGRTDRTRANYENSGHCDEFLAHCVADAPECFFPDGRIDTLCTYNSDKPRCLAYYGACPTDCGKEQDICRSCRADQFCAAYVNDALRVGCLCYDNPS